MISISIFLNDYIRLNTSGVTLNADLETKTHHQTHTYRHGGSRGLMLESRTRNPKVAGSSPGVAGIIGGGSECKTLSPPSIPRLRCPWASPRTPNCSPGVCLLCVCVCVCVCAHIGWLNAEHEFWVWVTKKNIYVQQGFLLWMSNIGSVSSPLNRCL